MGMLCGRWPRGSPAPAVLGRRLGPLAPGGKPGTTPAKGQLQFIRRRGNPELRNEKKALRHRRRENLEPFGLGETPVVWRQESSAPPAEEILGAAWLGGNPGPLAKRKA